jgi:ubiquitin-protein ligase
VLFGHPGSGLEWEGEMSLCEALELVKERLRVRKFEITSSEEFFEEIGNILVSDMVTTFKPLANNIYLWSGEYKALYGAQLKKVHYEVRLSQNYPLSPPRVSVVDPKPFINDNVETDGRVKEEFITQKHFRRTDLKTVAKLVKTLRPEPKKGLLDKVMGVFR